MDTFTQGIIGACAAQLGMKKKQARLATFCGALGGFAPDADTFIQSSTDPLLGKMFHRHFTHSLFFIPIGGLIVSTILYFILLRKYSFKTIYLYSTLGYATHALLDACTSYGTQLFWPLTSLRVAWDNIAIIDPLYTIPLLIGVIVTFISRHNRWAKIMFTWSMIYLSFGFIQNFRAVNILKEHVAKRDQKIERYRVMPTLGNLFLWRTLYESKGRYYTDAVSLWPGISQSFYSGESIPKLDIRRDFPFLKEEDLQYRDIERFRWFAQDWLAISPKSPNVIGDLRYSAEIKGVDPLWGIEILPEKRDQHIKNYQLRIKDRNLANYLKFFEVKENSSN